jgi:hypothetical protein
LREYRYYFDVEINNYELYPAPKISTTTILNMGDDNHEDDDDDNDRTPNAAFRLSQQNINHGKWNGLRIKRIRKTFLIFKNKELIRYISSLSS